MRTGRNLGLLAGAGVALVCVGIAMAGGTAPVAGSTTYQATGDVGQGNTTYTVLTAIASPNSSTVSVSETWLRAGGAAKGANSEQATRDSADDCEIVVTLNAATKEKAVINICEQTCKVWVDTDGDGKITPADPGDPGADPPVPPTPAEQSVNLPMTNHVNPPA